MKFRSFCRLSILTIGSSFTALAAMAMPVICSLVGAMPCQTEAQGPTPITFSWKYKYDVVSIKPVGHVPNTGPAVGYRFEEPPDGLRIPGATLFGLVLGSYLADDDNLIAFREDQIFGMPAWARSELYAIDAKMDESVAEQLAKLNPSQQRYARTLMLRALVADYFKMAEHAETRESSVFYLVVAKNGPKLKKATLGETYPVGPGGKVGPGGPWKAGWVVMDPFPVPRPSSKYIGLGAPLTRLVQLLSVRVQATVLDRTGLAGDYDFELQFSGTNQAPETESEPPFPPLFTAIQQQLGLKLESGKGPAPVMVVDHAERPSTN
jgi:uncharacterized protein (TIGR03435 family)